MSVKGQEYGYYGGAQGSRMLRGAQRTYSGGSDLFAEPLTPPGNHRQSSQRRNGDEEVYPNEFSPGLLDLHSLDTELLPEVWFLIWTNSAFVFLRGLDNLIILVMRLDITLVMSVQDVQLD